MRRLERYLVLVQESGGSALIVLNKSDLCDAVSERLKQVTAVAQRVPVLVMSARESVQDLRVAIRGRTVAFLGSSGVGKSTIVNSLIGEQSQTTLPVREVDSRGRHGPAPSDGRGGESVPGGPRPSREVDRSLGDLRGHASWRDSGAPVEVGRRRHSRRGAAPVQASPGHAEEWQGSRGGDFRWHAVVVEAVGRTGSGPLTGWVRLSVREDCDSDVARQSLAAVYAAEVGENRVGVGDVQVLRKTNPSLSKKYGVDPKVTSDQRGHGIGVSMDVYTSSDLEQKREAVNKLEAGVLRKRQPERRSA